AEPEEVVDGLDVPVLLVLPGGGLAGHVDGRGGQRGGRLARLDDQRLGVDRLELDVTGRRRAAGECEGRGGPQQVSHPCLLACGPGARPRTARRGHASPWSDFLREGRDDTRRRRRVNPTSGK